MRRNFDYIIISLNKYEKLKQVCVSYRILFILLKLMKTICMYFNINLSYIPKYQFKFIMLKQFKIFYSLI